jgi:hypothetical protein
VPNRGSPFYTAEKSGGKPVELYTFARGSWLWRYTSANREVTVAETGLTFIPAKIQRGELRRKDETGAQSVEITFGRKLGILSALRDGTTLPMIGSLHRYHEAAGGLPALWIWGDVGGLSLEGSMATCQITSSEAKLPSPVPRALISTQCQVGTYTPRCGVNAVDFMFETTIDTIARSIITVASVDGHPDGYYSNGVMQVGDSYFHIEAHVGENLKIFGLLPEFVNVGDDVRIFKGDDKTFASCKSFNNHLNFVGFPYLPQSNPLLIRAGS